MPRFLPCVLLVVLVFLVLSCAPFATYPPIEGARSIDNPAWEPVPSIIADSIRHVHSRFGIGHDDYAINLPAGCPALVYEKVIAKLGTGLPMTDASQWAYHVVEIRSRALNAECDIIYPRENAPHGMVTLHLENDLGRYQVKSTKLWNLPASAPQPNYVPEPVEGESDSDEN
jgi:hypothetical protein